MVTVVNVFNCYGRILSMFPKNEKRKNCFLAACRNLTLIIHSVIFEYNIVGDTKAALLRCIPFISKIKNGDVIYTGQHMNYQNFPNLQILKILKNSFHSIKLEHRDPYGEKVPFKSVSVTRAVLMFRTASDNLY